MARLVILDNLQLEKENASLQQKLDAGAEYEDLIAEQKERISSLELHKEEIQKKLNKAIDDLSTLEKEKDAEEQKRLEVEYELAEALVCFSERFFNIAPIIFYVVKSI